MNEIAEPLPFYSKICKKVSKFNYFKSLIPKIDNPQLLVATEHLFKKYSLVPQEIYCTAINLFLISIVISTILFFISKSLLFLIFGIIIGISVYYFVTYKLINEYEKEKLIILKYVEIAFHEFLIILSTTKSIFDSIFFISQGNYPFISEKFRNMIWEINLGADPESTLFNFANDQPSEPLKERILSILATNFSYNIIIEELERSMIEKETEYQKFTKELDSKLVLLLGFCTFIPLLLLILIILNAWTNNYWIFSFPIIYFFIIDIFKKRLKSNFLLFGSDNSEFNEGNKSELEELIKFLSIFGNFLKRGLSIEHTLINSINQYKGALEPKLNDMLNKMLLKNWSFLATWKNFSQNCSNRQSTQLLDLINRMLEKDSINSGIQIISIITQLKKNENLIKKRDLIYKAQQFKVQIISIISSFVLGLLASLAPIFSLAISFSNFGQKFQGIFLKMTNFLEHIPLLITLISILVISSYNMAKIIRLNKPIKNIFVSLFIFGVTWFISNSYFLNFL